MATTRASRILRLAAAALALVVAAAAATAAADAQGAAPQKVADIGHAASYVRAQDDQAVFSSANAQGSRYSLMLASGGTARPVDVPSRRAAFDASLGTRQDGSRVIVLTACEHVSTSQDALIGLPLWAANRGCKIMEVDPISGSRHLLVTQQTSGGSIYLPTEANGVLVYARERILNHSKHRYRFEIARRSVTGRTTVLPAGSGAEFTTSGFRDLGYYGPGVTSLAQSSDGHITFTWATASRSCPAPKDYDEPKRSEVWTVVAGHAKRLASTCNANKTVVLLGASATPDSWLELGRPVTGGFAATSVRADGSRSDLVLAPSTGLLSGQLTPAGLWTVSGGEDGSSLFFTSPSQPSMRALR